MLYYYTLQLATGKEALFIQKAKKLLVQTDIQAHFIYLTREMTIRRHGILQKQILPLFPSYIFLEISDKLPNELYTLLRTLPEFYHFLPHNKNPQPLHERDLQIITHFMQAGTKIGSSLVTFTTDQHITVISGPLKGLEGNIIKVNRRKQRAKIRLNFEHTVMTIDLAFDEIENSSENALR